MYVHQPPTFFIKEYYAFIMNHHLAFIWKFDSPFKYSFNSSESKRLENFKRFSSPNNETFQSRALGKSPIVYVLITSCKFTLTMTEQQNIRIRYACDGYTVPTGLEVSASTGLEPLDFITCPLGPKNEKLLVNVGWLTSNRVS